MAVSLSNPFRMGSQNHALLERLRLNPVFNHEIVREFEILKYTGRISEIRKKIRIQGFDLVVRRIHGQVHEYRIVVPGRTAEEKERTAREIMEREKAQGLCQGCYSSPCRCLPDDCPADPE